MQDHPHLHQMLQELAHYAAGGDVHPHVEQMAREIEHFAKHRPEAATYDDMLAHTILHRASGGSIHRPTEIGVDEAPNSNTKWYMPPDTHGQGMPVGGIDLHPGQPGQQFAPAPPQGQPPMGQPAPGQPAPGQPAPGQPPTGPQAPPGPPSNILNMTHQGQAMSAMKAPPPVLNQPVKPAPSLLKNGMARMAKGGSIKPVVRGIIKEQVTVIPNLDGMKFALMKAKR